MINIDCQGKQIDERTARFARSRFLEADFVAMHPAQKACVINASIKVGIIERVMVDVDGPFPLNVPVETFTGFRLVVDPNMVKNEIHFRDKNNVTIAKIVNLGVPDGETQQSGGEVPAPSSGQG